MNYLKKIVFVCITFFFTASLSADLPYFIDFQKVLNESTAGKKAQKELKNKLDQTIKILDKNQKDLQEQEKQIIQQKKLISPEEYKKKVDELRKKVSDLQKNRSNSLQKVSQQRSMAKQEILKNLNPIIQEYMKEKGIRMVLNKKDLILADDKLEITNEIMTLLNEKIKSVKLN